MNINAKTHINLYLYPIQRFLPLFFSILFHLLIFSKFINNFRTIKILEKDYVELALINKPNIVSESQAKEVKDDKKIITNNRSSKSTITNKEQIKKGVIQSQNISPKLISKNIKPKTPSESLIKNDSKKIDNAKLLLNDNELNKFSSNNFQQKAKVSDSTRAQTLNSNYQPFRMNKLFEKFGTPDYLPQVKEGEVTLLNAKADQYAVFVRRVAIQVFSYLRSKNWAQVGFAQARESKKMASIEAVMNREGKFVSMRLTDTSGSNGFDLVLKEAVKEGLWDRNPQMSAALEDGNIHFIFQARTWAEIIGDPGRERRWLLLATGLK